MTHKVIATMDGFRVYESREPLTEQQAVSTSEFVQACWPMAKVEVIPQGSPKKHKGTRP